MELANSCANFAVKDFISSRIYETTERSTPAVDSYLVQDVQKNLQVTKTCWFMQTLILENFTYVRSVTTQLIQGNLRQHVCGQHGKGWTAKCGKHFKWSPKMHRHTRKCKKCKAIIAKATKRKLHITKQLEKE